MNIFVFFIKNYQFIFMVFVMLLIVGLFLFFNMLCQEDFVFDIFNILVIVVYFGVNFNDIECQVVDLIEEVIKEFDDLKELCIVVCDGIVVIEVEFEFGVDFDDKYDEIQCQLNQFKDVFFSDLYSLEVWQININIVNIFQIVFIFEMVEYSQLFDEVENIKEEIELVKGVCKVELEVYFEEEVCFVFDFIKMMQVNFSVDDIECVIAGINVNIFGGVVKVLNKLFLFKIFGVYEDFEQIC